ncbi:MAG: class I fructose-bisphosphate aldolase [Candidatus Asgardarchaeia archaeon]
MSSGRKIRFGRIMNYKDNRSVIIAMDHGLSDGVLEGIEQPSETIKRVIAGGADAMILNPGIIKQNSEIISRNLGAIMRADFIFTALSPSKKEGNDVIATVERALRIGADAIIVNGFIGSENERKSISYLSLLVDECDLWDMPIVAEMKPEGVDKPWDAKYVKVAARVASELGVDLIKTYYTGDPKSFKEVIDSTPTPIVILGGPRLDSLLKVFQMVSDAVSAGAAGIAFGRNIWHKRDPKPMVQAMVDIIHNNIEPKEVMEKYF